MKNKNLLIVFVKNKVLGKVKTRLAKTIGNESALTVYSELLKLTEKEAQKTDTDIHVYYSEQIESEGWNNSSRFVQQGIDLGEKMKNAFKNGFDSGYSNIVLIGSDLPSLKSTIIKNAFQQLNNHDTVFGPAEDGGYYLIGMSSLKNYIFENKPWSKSHLLELTLQEIKNAEDTVSLLETLNDIDIYEDLAASSFFKNNPSIQQLITQTKLA